MTSLKPFTAAAAAALMIVQPSAAAELVGDELQSRRSAVYGGAYVRIPLGNESRVRREPRAGFAVGSRHVLRGSTAGAGEQRIGGNVVDIGLYRSGRPSLLIGGRQLLDERGRLQLRGGGSSAALVIGGIVVLAGIGYLLIKEQFDCDPNGECY